MEGAQVVKTYITPNELRLDSYNLAATLYRGGDGFVPDFMVALWRGGAPIGCYVHEYLKWHGEDVDHVAIRTSRYTGIDETASSVEVHSTSYLCDRLRSGAKVLLVDDVWDSGTSIEAFYAKLASELAFPVSELDVRVAVLYYKPERNKIQRTPHYYVHESNEWLVFPHELEGMTRAEVAETMGGEICELLKK